MIGISRSFVWILGAFVGTSLCAQLSQTDFSKRNQKIETKRFETTTDIPQTTERWMSKRFNTQKFSTQQHRFAGEKFKVQKMDLYSSDRFKTKELDLENIEPVIFRNSDEMFSSDELDKIRYNTLHHDAKLESRVADTENVRDIEDVIDQLSLADLNRYQFRRSHSREPGIPVQQAASAEVAE